MLEFESDGAGLTAAVSTMAGDAGGLRVDAVSVRVPDRFDEMAAFRAVAALSLGGDARSQVPLDSVAFTASGNLAARPYDRPPQDTLLRHWRRSRFH